MLTTLWCSWSSAQTCLNAALLGWTHGHSVRRGTDFIEHMEAWQDSNKEAAGSGLLTCGKQLILAFSPFSRWLRRTSKEGRWKKRGWRTNDEVCLWKAGQDKCHSCHSCRAPRLCPFIDLRCWLSDKSATHRKSEKKNEGFKGKYLIQHF